MEILDLMKNLSIKHSDENSEQTSFKSIAADIDDVTTEFLLSEYTDRTLLIITQFKKVGSMVLIERDQVHGPSGANDVYTTKVLFGNTSDECLTAARFLAEAIQIKKPTYIFLCLKSYDIETVKACKDIILHSKSTCKEE